MKSVFSYKRTRGSILREEFADNRWQFYYDNIPLQGYAIADLFSLFAQMDDRMPDELTYPAIQPHLYREIQNWLNLQSKADELWDIYDENRQLTGRLQRRGDPMQEGDYHLSVHVWMQNSRGELLITQRSPNKGYPLMWESTGGSALTGDDSLTAALREVEEETGLQLKKENGKVLLSLKRTNDFCDVWYFRQDFDLKDVILQEGETVDKKYATAREIIAMRDRGEFVSFRYLDQLLDMIDKENG